MTGTGPAEAMAHCRRTLGRSGSTFAQAFRLLPPDQRDAMTAFYAYCREVDDAVDLSPDPGAAGLALGTWSSRLAAAFDGEYDGPTDEALSWAVRKFDIDRAHLELILEGVGQDLVQSRYETFDDLYEYCYRVASAVGLVCVSILDHGSPGAHLYAELAGVAVQITNIVRDVGEDAEQQRIYLPLQDLRVFRVAESDILQRRMTPELKNLLRFQARRALAFYDMAAAALPRGSQRRLFFAEALIETYRCLLEEIVRQDFPVFQKRVSVGMARKLTIALKHRLNPLKGLAW